MSTTAIRVDSVGKRYRIGTASRRPQTLREAVGGVVAAPLRNLQRLRRLTRFNDSDDRNVVWALDNVSFELRHGEVLGIIGRNGAGKSTLLKILSRITQPTTGRARVHGRVSSLLEVGTGFHPELTGRDNIYLNGSILGMPRSAIARKFDQIVDFAGVGRFIDTPVKRYSSGMYLRLAFAVAAHLEPDILIVDEVLAVGDAEFQQKCLRQMGDVSREGRTILFVSHNLAAIQRLCPRSILLDRGRLVDEGETGAMVKRYLDDTATPESSPGERIVLAAAARRGSGAARVLAVAYTNPGDPVSQRPYSGEPLTISLELEASADLPRVSLACSIRDQLGTKLINADTDMIGQRIGLPKGRSVWVFRVSRVYLKPGMYQLDLWVADPAGVVYDHVQPALRLEVFERPRLAQGVRIDGRYDGVVLCEFDVVPGPLAELVGAAAHPSAATLSPVEATASLVD